MQGSLISDKNDVKLTYVHLRQYFMIPLRMEMYQKRVVEKIETHVLWPITFFSESRAVFEIM
jgi:hypothetical protein